MGGYVGEKKLKILRRRPSARDGVDPCDLEFELDLVGIYSDVSQDLKPGDLLRVELVPRDNVTSVVCRTSNGRVVGTLAAFRGLAQLINCLMRGIGYAASVIFASATRCTVRVARGQL